MLRKGIRRFAQPFGRVGSDGGSADFRCDNAVLAGESDADHRHFYSLITVYVRGEFWIDRAKRRPLHPEGNLPLRTFLGRVGGDGESAYFRCGNVVLAGESIADRRQPLRLIQPMHWKGIHRIAQLSDALAAMAEAAILA